MNHPLIPAAQVENEIPGVQMSPPAVSIVMAEFNTDPIHLAQSIQSMLDQTLQDFELLIVDDGGCNDLQGIASTFGDPRIRILHNDGNRGLVHSLNSAVHSARSEYIARMDTDDIAARDRLEKLYRFMLAHPEFTVIGSLAVEFSNKNRLGRLLGSAGEKGASNLMRGDVPIHPSVMFRRSEIIAAGLYDDHHRAEDLALWCKLHLAQKRIYVLDEVLLNYRVNPADYQKRRLRNRMGEIKVRLAYYPRLGAGLVDYLYIAKSVIAGALPASLMIFLRSRLVLGPKREMVA